MAALRASLVGVGGEDGVGHEVLGGMHIGRVDEVGAAVCTLDVSQGSLVSLGEFADDEGLLRAGNGVKVRRLCGERLLAIRAAELHGPTEECTTPVSRLCSAQQARCDCDNDADGEYGQGDGENQGIDFELLLCENGDARASFGPDAERHYTRDMLLSFLVMGSAFFAQGAEDGMTPYIFKMRHRDEAIYALVDTSRLDDVSFEIVLDEPWRPIDERRERLQGITVEQAEPQEPAIRRERLRRGWLAVGGMEVQTAAGKRWILKEEYDWAERAKALARKAESAQGEDTVVSGDVEEVYREEAPESPGFWQLWGLHIAVVGAALVLVGVIGGIAFRAHHD